MIILMRWSKAQCHSFLKNPLAGINEVLGECWRIYHSPDENLNWFHRLAALKLAKECSEEIYSLTKNGPWVMGARRIMVEFESIKRESGIANQLGNEQLPTIRLNTK